MTSEKTYPNDIVPPIHFENSQWVVTNYGLENLETYYQIRADALFSRRFDPHLRCQLYELPLDMALKTFVDIELFISGFLAAATIYQHRIDLPALDKTLQVARGYLSADQDLRILETIATAGEAPYAATEWMVGWNAEKRQVWVGPWPDRTNWCDDFLQTLGCCNRHFYEAMKGENSDARLLKILEVFHQIVVGDGIPARSAHFEFLKIADYRERFGGALQ
jgi:hypothetical protein